MCERERWSRFESAEARWRAMNLIEFHERAHGAFELSRGRPEWPEAGLCHYRRRRHCQTLQLCWSESVYEAEVELYSGLTRRNGEGRAQHRSRRSRPTAG